MIRVATYGVALLLIGASSAGADWNSAIAASNPLNWYRLDETSGSIAYDYGSEGRNATYGGPGNLQSPTLGMPGLVGTGVEIHGVVDTIRIDGPQLTGDWSAELVLKKTAHAPSQVLLEDPRTPFYFGLKLEQWRDTHQLGYTQYGVKDYYFSPAASAPLGQFSHITYVKTASGLQLYLNGSFIGSNSAPIPLPRYGIGGGLDPLYAILDEVVIYNRALPPEEISGHFAAIPESSTLALAITAIVFLPVRARRATD